MNRRRNWLGVGALVACVVLSSCTQVTLSEPGPTALTPGSGENVATVKAAHIGSTNPGFGQGECPSDGWGWHFVLPGNSTDFVQLIATFTREGERVTLLASEYEPTEKHAYVYTDGPGWELAASEALVRGTGRTYNLSHVCSGPDGEATTTAPTTTTTTTFATTVPEESTTTTPGDTTSLTQGEVTSTSIDETTTTPEAATTTTGEGPTTTGETTTSSVETTTTVTSTTVTSTTVAETTSSSDPGESTSTTTPDAGGEGGGSTTSAAGGEGGGSALTSGGDVGSDTLPRTGGGEVPIAGLSGLLLAAGATLLLMFRRSAESD